MIGLTMDHYFIFEKLQMSMTWLKNYSKLFNESRYIDKMRTLSKVAHRKDSIYYYFSDDLEMTSLEIIKLMNDLKLFNMEVIATKKIEFKETAAPKNPEKFSKVPEP